MMMSNMNAIINKLALALVIHILAVWSAVAGDASWSVDADGSWSLGSNWSGGSPADGAASTAYFTNAITANRFVTVDSSPQTIGNITFGSSNYTFTITSGTLNLSGTITVNSGCAGTVASAISASSLTKTGDGTLNLNGVTSLGSINIAYNNSAYCGTVVVGTGALLSAGSGPASYVCVGWGSGSSANGAGVLDASASSSFTANVGNFMIGGTCGGTGTLKLGTNNTITASTQFGVCKGSWGGPGGSGTVTITNNSTTTIHAPIMYVGYNTPNGTTYGDGTFSLGSGGTLNLDGISGGRTAVFIGYASVQSGYGGGANYNSIMDLSGGIVNLKISSLVVGRKSSTSSHTSTGTLTLSGNAANHLDISGTGNVVTIGYADGSGPAVGVLTIGNLDATSAITSSDNSTAILLGYKGSSGASTGTLNLSGGTLTITTAGSAIAGGGGTSRLNLKDCTLVAGSSSTNWITGLSTATLTNNVTFNSGTNSIVIAQAFSGNGTLVKAGAGSLTLSGSNTYIGATTVVGGSLLVDGSIATPLAVASGAAFGGTGVIGGSVTVSNGALVILTQGAPLAINGSLILNNNVVHVRLPEGLTNGFYRLTTFNPSGSSGRFSDFAIIDSGSAAYGTPMIVTSISGGTVDMRMVSRGTVVIIR